MEPRFSADEGFIYPLIYRIFYFFQYFSLLKWIELIVNLFKNNWKPSRRFVDIYVSLWLLLVGVGSVTLLHILFLASSDKTAIYPICLRNLVLVLIIWRLIDISQRWWHVLIVPPFKAKSPRIIILILINYLEIVIAFGVIGFLFKLQPYYNIPGEIQIWDSLRASVGILTPLGIPSIPQTWTTGALFYIEFVMGLFFLVIIINVVLSYLKNSA